MTRRKTARVDHRQVYRARGPKAQPPPAWLDEYPDVRHEYAIRLAADPSQRSTIPGEALKAIVRAVAASADWIDLEILSNNDRHGPESQVLQQLQRRHRVKGGRMEWVRINAEDEPSWSLAVDHALDAPWMGLFVKDLVDPDDIEGFRILTIDAHSIQALFLTAHERRLVDEVLHAVSPPVRLYALV